MALTLSELLMQDLVALARGWWHRFFAAPISILLFQVVPILAQAPAQKNGSAGMRPMPVGVAAFVDVTVVPMDSERVLRHQTVLIEHGRITALGPAKAVQVPAGAAQINGREKYLLPGLADMHVHLTVANQYNHGVGVNVGAVLRGYLAVGVTTLRNMMGEPGHLALRDSIARGEVLGPRIYTAGPYPDTGNIVTPAAAVRFVTEQAAAGYDLIKIHAGQGGVQDRLTPAVLDTLVASASRAGLRVATDLGFESGPITVEHQLQAHVGSIEHLSQYMPLSGRDLPNAIRIRELAVATSRAGTWCVPTEVTFRARVPAVPPQDSAEFDRYKVAQQIFATRQRLIRALQDAGAGLLLGTDNTGNHYDWVSRELQLLVQAGLTPYQALLAGTRNAATYFGTLDSTGTVTVGKRADLVLVNGNPIEDIRRMNQIAGVMLGGQWLPPEVLRPQVDGSTPP